jgi:hypothetical protein
MDSSIPGHSRWTDPTVPSSARIYDYLLGGKDHFPADRTAAEHIRAALPEASAAAWANRGFHRRAAKWIARQGITQFIDLGCGLPTTPSTHQGVQQINPAARVLYIDHDPMAIAHARGRLHHPHTSAVLADARDPDALLTAVLLNGLIDLKVPTGLLCTATLEHIPDHNDPWICLAHLVSALASGSYLALSHLTSDQMSPAGITAILDAYHDATDPIYPRTLPQISKFFDGLHLIPPYDGADPQPCKAGLWGAEDPLLADDASSQWRWAGVARVPAPTPTL